MGHFIPASNWFLVWDHQVYPVKMGKPATAFRDLNHPLPWSMQPLECARPIVQCMPASPQVCSLRTIPLIMYEGTRTEAEAPAAGDTSHSSNTYIYHVLKGRVQRIRRPRGKKSRTEMQRGVNTTERRRREHKREANREEMRGWRRHCPCLSQQTKAAFNTLRISNYWERSAPSHCVTACGLLSCLTWGRFGKTIENAIVSEVRPSNKTDLVSSKMHQARTNASVWTFACLSCIWLSWYVNGFVIAPGPVLSRGHKSLRQCAEEMTLDLNELFGSQRIRRSPQSRLLVPHTQFKCC